MLEVVEMVFAADISMLSEFSHHHAAGIVATPEKSRVCRLFSRLGMFFESVLEREKKRLVCVKVPAASLAIQELLCLNNS